MPLVFRRTALCIAAAVACSIDAASSAAAADAPPNFIVINIDDLGYADIGAFGSKLNRTPNLDRLAAEGMKLTCFYAAPVCSPSRAALMTGCYPKRVGIPNVLFPGQTTGIADDESTVAELLKARGYATMCIGKWHLGDQPEFLPTRHGFDHYLGVPYSNDMGPAGEGARSSIDEDPKATGKPVAPKAASPKAAQQEAAQPKRPATNHPPIPLVRDTKVVERVGAAEQQTLVDRYTAEAVKFVREHRDGPFFLYLPHNAVHWPLYPSPKFRGQSKNGVYGDWVEEIDASVGQVVDAVRELGLAERTLVIFTSDNGGTSRAVNAPLRGFKGSTLEGGMREPTIVWWPGKIAPGTSTDALTSNMDVLPTLVGLAGGKVPSDRTIDGRDLWPLLSGKSRESPHDVFYYFKAQTLEAVRSGRWKLELASGKLYDLEADIGETTDTASANAETVAKLRALVEAADRDLGITGTGLGCRKAANIAGAKPIIALDGTVREEFR